jgi:hypothetical protein
MVLETKIFLTAPIEWSRGEDPEYPYEAEHEGHKLLVRLNDFPDEELYALIADGEEITNFDDWPAAWTRPGTSETDLNSHDPQPVRELLKVVDSEIRKQLTFLSHDERVLLELMIEGQSSKNISEILQLDVLMVRYKCNALEAKLRGYVRSKKKKSKV